MQTAATPARTRHSSDRVPQFMVGWQPWWPNFLRNIFDLFRRQPPLQLICAPGEFWPDVFVKRPLPWVNFAESGALHLACAFFFAVFGSALFSHEPIIAEDPFEHTTITYHPISEFLPEIKSTTPQQPRKQVAKPDPAFAKQQIISVPFKSDNTAQTIINPPHPNILLTEAKLPNLVVNTPNPAPPVAAIERPLLQLPDLTFKPIAPAPQVHASARLTPAIDLTVAKPAPTVARSSAAKLPDLQLAPIAPAPEIHAKVRALDLPVAKPTLAVPAISGITTARPLAAPIGDVARAVAPAPSTSGSSMVQPSGRLIALSISPAPPAAEIKVPDASRHGTFEASPLGRRAGTGAPDLPKATTTSDSSGSPASAGTGDGVRVSVAPALPSAVSSVRTPARPAADLRTLMAKASVPDVTRPVMPPSQRTMEDQVFGSRRSYSLQLNMPNLTSAGGSWVIHFAELKENTGGDVSTPVAMKKVDPAYPPELMEERIEGTVVLYAIIHADGNVSDVRILHGFNDRLDENARIALGKWHFQPAMKAGAPVDLEAVVQIPFKLRKPQF